MPKSTKRFILSSEKLNSHGFVVITAGIDLTDFLKNPIMYWLHNTPTGADPKSGLPIGYWTDIQVKDKEITGVPVFNDNDDFAMKIYNMVEHGTVRAASVSLEKPVSLDTDKAHWIPGQTKPTVLKCKLGEASIVDRGSNADAVTLSNDRHRQVFVNLNSKGADDFTAGKSAIGSEAAKAPDQQADQHTPATKAIFKNAVASGKFTQAEIDHLAKITTNDPDVLAAMKGIIKKTKIRPELIEGKYHHTLIKQAATKSYDEIHASDCQLRGMKADAPELYKAKFFEKFGRMPGDVA